MIHEPLFISIHNFRGILLILISDASNLIYSSKFTVYVVVAFTKKEKRQSSKKDRTANTQPFNEYFKLRILLILGFLRHGESKLFTLIKYEYVKYEYDEYFKL